MENKRVKDIDNLLAKLRSENTEHKNFHPNKATNKNSEHCEDEEEEYGSLPSRYNYSKTYNFPDVDKENIEEESENESSDEDVEDPKEKIRKRLEEIRANKFKLGRAVRIRTESKVIQEIPKETRRPLSQLRPQSAKSSSSRLPTTNLKAKKNDPVAMFHKHQNE